MRISAKSPIISTDDTEGRLGTMIPEKQMFARQISVLVAAPQATLRAELRLLLRREPDIKVVGEAQTAEEAYRMVQKLRPHVAVIATGLPGDAAGAVRRIRKNLRRVRVVAVATQIENESVLAMLRAGADGCVAGRSVGSDLISAVRAASQGQSLLCAATTDRLVEEIVNSPSPSQVESVLPDREKPSRPAKRLTRVAGTLLAATGAVLLLLVVLFQAYSAYQTNYYNQLAYASAA